MLTLAFHGAAGEVTGSCYLVTSDKARVLVDFGIHQGDATADQRNRTMPPIDPPTLDAVVLTHGHLDHCGRLPQLTNAGFRGKIFTTPGSAELTTIILQDSGHLQDADAERATRYHYKTPLPLYTLKDIEKVIPRFQGVPYDTETTVAPGVRARFVDAGHILGSASVVLSVDHTGSDGRPKTSTLIFSGDVGVKGAPLLRDPIEPSLPAGVQADAVILESTYGDRDHRSLADTKAELLEILTECHHDCGKILIPAFAIGRTQDLIYHIGCFVRAKQVPVTDMYVDSPMATAATNLYRQHREVYDAEAKALAQSGVDPLSFPGLQFTHTVDDSKAINNVNKPIVVIAASGMCTGGRILHHLANNLPKPGTRVVLVGYQGVGTLGRQLVDGASSVRIFGQQVAVNAQVHTLGGFSAHAGQSELLEWGGMYKGRTKRLFLTHGEDGPRGVLAKLLQEKHGMSSLLPKFGDVVNID